MLFRQRRKAGLVEQVGLWLWPRRSFRRSTLYFLKRILRLSGTPHAVALGIAIGAGVACTPFLGFHFMITAALAWIFGGNIIAGAVGSWIGNPITYPVLWAASYEAGKVMLGEFGKRAPSRLEHDLLHKSWSQLWPVVEPMTLGSIPIGLALGAVAYLLVYKAVAAYQVARRKRLAERRHDRVDVAPEAPALADAGRDL